jgi:hypothetical protein
VDGSDEGEELDLMLGGGHTPLYTWNHHLKNSRLWTDTTPGIAMVRFSVCIQSRSRRDAACEPNTTVMSRRRADVESDGL